MNIDFRKEIDPWCEYNPKILVCDGTHVGISLKNLKLANPVTAPDTTLPMVTPNHKRYDFILFSSYSCKGENN